jgi:hypothetical protein
MFIVSVNQRIGLEFTVNPFSDKNLELRGIVTSSTVGALPKLTQTQHNQADHWHISKN